MRRFIKDNKRDIMIICMIVFWAIPLGVYILAKHIIPPSTGNDWVSFLGSYAGTIVGACVAVYVLVRTLNHDKEMQNEKEINEFCNLLVEKGAILAQRYETAMYEMHDYFIAEKTKTIDLREVTEAYRKFISSHHSAKIVLYEILNYLEIRKDINIFHTAQFQSTLQITEKAYDEFSELEEKVGKATKISEINEKEIIDLMENCIDMLKQYEKELLDKTMVGKGKEMRTLKEIYEEVEACAKTKNRVEKATCYLKKFKEEIGEDKCKLLAYKNMCETEIEMNSSSFWISICAVFFSVISVLVAMESFNKNSIKDIAIELLFLIIATFVLMLSAVNTYVVSYRKKKRYSLMVLVLEQIDKEINK